MKKALLLSTCLLFCGAVTAHGHDLPPSDTTPYELLSPHEHAELYLNLVSHLYYALIPRMDSVTDAESAAKVKADIIALHRRLNMAIDHMEHNPDTRREVLSILNNNPARRQRLVEEEARYNASAQRCRDTGLIPDIPAVRRVSLPQ